MKNFKTAFLSALTLCLCLFLTIRCGLYAEQNRALTEENEALSTDLSDKEQALTDNKQTVAEMTQETETESGFLKKNGLYLIDDVRQLWALQKLIATGGEMEPGVPAASASYRLRNDIEFYSDPVPLFYLGTEEMPFRGSFDGDGHRIRGYFPLIYGVDYTGPMFHTDKSAKIENLYIDDQRDNLTGRTVSIELTEQWEVAEAERHLPDFPICNIATEISDWDLDARQIAEKMHKHWEKLLAQEDGYDCSVSMTFYPRSEDFEETPAVCDTNDHGTYIQELKTALLTLAGAEYTDVIEEILEQEEGYLWFLRLERIEGLICCTFEIGRPTGLTGSFDEHYYLITEGLWEGKEVSRQCFRIPYIDGAWYHIGTTSSYQVQREDIDFDSRQDLLIHEGFSGGSGGHWNDYHALVWKDDIGQFSYFPSFPAQVSALDFNRRRVIFHTSTGWDSETVSVYEIVNGEYICTKELVCQRNSDGTVNELFYYEMGELVQTHRLSDLDERETLYPDMNYWLKG